MARGDASADEARTGARRFAVLLFLGALAVRLLFLWQSRGAPSFGRPLVDALTHHNLAKALAAGGGHGIAAGGGFAALFDGHRPFLEPLFLAALYAVAGPSVLAAQLAQAVAGAATCVLAYFLGRQLAGERVGRVAGLLTALYGPLVFWQTELEDAGWAAFFAVALPLLWLRAERSPAAGVLLGASAAGAVLARPDFAPAVALLALWLALRSFRAGRLATGAAPALLGFALCAGPIALAAWQTTGRAALTPATGAVNLHIGNNARRCETLLLRPGEEFFTLGDEARAAGFVGLRAQDDYFRTRFLAYVQGDPAGFLAGLAHKAAQYANGREVPRNTDLYVLREWSPLLGALAWKAGRFGFPWGLFFPLALVGLWLGRRRWPAPLWVLALTQPLLLVLVFVAGRHRVPLVPLLAVPAALSCVAIWDALRARRWRPALALGAAVAVLAVLTSLPPPSCEERLDYRAELFALLARQTLNEGDLDASEALLREALRTSPASPDANFRMGRVWLARGEPARAVRFLDTALAAGPEPLALAQRCRAHLALGSAAEARADCEAALRLRPAERLAELFLGDVERAEGTPDAARARWQRLAGGDDSIARQARARLAALAREGH